MYQSEVSGFMFKNKTMDVVTEEQDKNVYLKKNCIVVHVQYTADVS